MKKFLCLFAGYDKDGIIDDYVIDSIKRYAKFCDVYYLADCEIEKKQMQRLAPFVKNAFAYRHQKYDFGSYSELIKKIGWTTICKYNALILTNDSCYGPLYDINEIATDFIYKNCCDFYGFTSSQSKTNLHIQSFFFIFKHNIIINKNFQNFFNNIKHFDNKIDIVLNYEFGLSSLLYKEGFKSDTFIKKYNFYYPRKVVKQNGFLLKYRYFTRPEASTNEDLTNLLQIAERQYKNYDFNLIYNHLKRMNVDINESVKLSVLNKHNYKTLQGIKNTFDKYSKSTHYLLFIYLNFLVFLNHIYYYIRYSLFYHYILRRYFVKPYKSIRKHVFGKY